MEIIITIFDMTGRPVRTIWTVNQSEGFFSEPVEWDGTNEYGEPVDRGLYLFRIHVKHSYGIAEKTGKLIIIR
jgi:flagellar hook assembly protein FlgD